MLGLTSNRGQSVREISKLIEERQQNPFCVKIKQMIKLVLDRYLCTLKPQ
jgi:hypothetical protein